MKLQVLGKYRVRREAAQTTASLNAHKSYSLCKINMCYSAILILEAKLKSMVISRLATDESQSIIEL